jgi:hypothetical protein
MPVVTVTNEEKETDFKESNLWQWYLPFSYLGYDFDSIDWTQCSVYHGLYHNCCGIFWCMPSHTPILNKSSRLEFLFSTFCYQIPYKDCHGNLIDYFTSNSSSASSDTAGNVWGAGAATAMFCIDVAKPTMLLIRHTLIYFPFGIRRLPRV